MFTWIPDTWRKAPLKSDVEFLTSLRALISSISLICLPVISTFISKLLKGDTPIVSAFVIWSWKTMVKNQVQSNYCCGMRVSHVILTIQYDRIFIIKKKQNLFNSMLTGWSLLFSIDIRILPLFWIAIAASVHPSDVEFICCTFCGQA